MKLLKLFIVITIFFTYQSAYAQVSPPIQTKTEIRNVRVAQRGVPLDTNEVIYDESGNTLKYYQSQRLLNTGEYTIVAKGGRPGDPGTTKHLEKTTPAQLAAMYERFKKFMAIPGAHLRDSVLLDVEPLLTKLNNLEIDHKVIVMIFWNADCPPCTESFDSLNNFFKDLHNPEKIAILAITTDDKGKVNAKLREKPLLYARFLNDARSITSAYDLNNYPAYVVTDKDHVILFAAKGSSPMSFVAFKNAVRKVLE